MKCTTTVIDNQTTLWCILTVCLVKPTALANVKSTLIAAIGRCCMVNIISVFLRLISGSPVIM